MKDILVTVLSVLLTILMIFCIVKGVSIADFEVLSLKEIKNSSLALDKKIEDVSNLKNISYKKNYDDLQNASKELTKIKDKYLELASMSTETEIEKAGIEQTYAMEYLLDKVGRYATKEDLSLTLNIASSGINNKYNLTFNVSGSYVGIINYIYKLENDSDLLFRIENFKASGDEVVKANFTVYNVGIKQETITTGEYTTNDKKDGINENLEGLDNTEEKKENFEMKEN